MEPRTRVLAVDLGLALLAIALGGAVTPGLSAGVVVLVALGTSVAVAGLFLAEQTDVLAVVDEHRPGSLVIAGAVTFGVALALVVGRVVVPWPSGPLLAGAGAGLAGYRTVYGVVRPLPTNRVAQVRGGWRGPGRED